jgi:hypothetical protein
MTALATTETFDYSALPSETAEALRKQAARIRSRTKEATAAIIEIGRDLIAVQDHLEHGQFGAWVEAECGFTDRTARNYMRAAEFAEDKSEIVSVLEPSAVYMLAAKSTPSAAGDDVAQRLARGEILTAASVKNLVEVHKAEQRRAAKTEERNRRRRKDVSERTRRRREADQKRHEEDRRRRKEAAKAAAEEIVGLGKEVAAVLVRIWNDHDIDKWDVMAEVGKIVAGDATPPPALAEMAAQEPLIDNDRATELLKFLGVKLIRRQDGTVQGIKNIGEGTRVSYGRTERLQELLETYWLYNHPNFMLVSSCGRVDLDASGKLEPGDPAPASFEKGITSERAKAEFREWLHEQQARLDGDAA